MDNLPRVKILSDLREKLDGRGKHDPERELYIEGILRSFLSDLGEGGKRQSSYENKVVAVLELLLKSVKAQPECFLGGTDRPQQSYFSVWIIHRLVTFLGTQSCSILHEKSIEAVYALTMLLKYKQQNLYISMVGVFVLLLKDLYHLIFQMFVEKTLPASHLPVILQHFKAVYSCETQDDVSVTIKSELDAWTILGNLSEILFLLLDDICQAFTCHFTTLWKIFRCQATWYKPNVQKVALRCLGKLLEWRPLAVEVVSDDAFHIIVHCLQLMELSSNEDRDEKSLDDSSQDALAGVIANSLQFTRGRKLVPVSYLDSLMKVLCKLTRADKTVVNMNLKGAIAEILCTVCDQGRREPVVNSVASSLRVCARNLIDCIGECDDCQYVAKCLCKLILYDLVEKKLQDAHSAKKPRLEATNLTTNKLAQVASNAKEHSNIFEYFNSKFRQLRGVVKDNSTSKNVWLALDGVVLVLRIYSLGLKDQYDVTDDVRAALTKGIQENTQELTSTIIKSLEHLLNYLRMKTPDENLVKCFLTTLLDFVRTLVFHNIHKPPLSTDPRPLEQDLLLLLLSIASLPWIPYVNTEYRGKVPCFNGWNQSKMKLLAETIAPYVEHEKYFELLVLFPRHYWVNWRTYVFKISMLDNVGAIQRSALDLLPVFMASVEDKQREEILSNLKHVKRELVQESLAQCLGHLGCALFGCVDLQRMADLEEFPLKLKPFCCTVCNANKNERTPVVSVAKSSKYDEFFRQALAWILPGALANTKLAFVVSFQRLTNHVEFSRDYCSQVVNQCIELIEDQDYDIRVKFSKLLPCLTKQDVNITKTIVAKVKEVFTKVSAKKKTRLQETIVYTIGELGKEAKDDLLLVVIISLLETLLSDTKTISSLAFTQIRAVAKYKRKSMQELFGDLKFHICKFMVDKVISQQQESPKEENDACLDVFAKVSRVFNFKSVKALLQNTQSIIVPQLVKKAVVQSSFVLRQFAKHLKVNYRKDLLLLNFNFIFSYLVRTCTGEELKEALAFVERETDVDIGSLLRSDSQSVVNQLLLHLKSSYNKVFTGLTILASKDDSCVGDTEITNAEQMAEFLHPRLLGILAFFNTVLLDDKNIDEKYLALGSLVKLMQMMGPKHITVVRVKVMAILKLALHFESREFRELCCGAWDCFVRSLDMTSLRSMLGHIVVTLIPLLEHSIEKVSSVLHYLIVEKQGDLKDSFKDIYYIPDYPQLSAVNRVLKRATRASSTNLRVEVTQILKGVAHESKDVRHHAVSRLKAFLHEHQKELQEYITNKDEVDPVVTSLINTLIDRCSEPVRSTQVKVGECLGELGAIDPGWLDKPRQTLNEETIVYEMKCDSPSFAVDLLNELVRAFLAAADTRSQDCSAYAIQEVLQIYECASKSASSPGHKIWSELPEHIQEVLKPHLHSKYVHSAQPNRAKPTKPIYFSNNGKNFSDWISTWTLELVSKVQNRKALRLFKACSAVFKHDINTAIFLLPHIILYVAIDGSSGNHQEVYDEILAVLKDIEKQHDTTVRTLATGQKDFSHISAQTIFSFLDYLTRWARLKADGICKTQILSASRINPDPSGATHDDGLSKVLQFLEGIPQNTLATASFHCKAYARSLMHFEQFIEKSKEDLQVHLNSIQQLYWALNEPDGVLGVAAVRKCPASLYEETLEHESAGKLRDAVACYERAIQLEPDKIDNHKRLMSCWIVLGQVSTALEHANGVLTRRPGWTNSINSYRIEACWRLGQWDALESYAKLEEFHHGFQGWRHQNGSYLRYKMVDVNNETCCTDWSTGVGKILLAAKKKDKDSFSKCIFELRSAQMEPLSAASMESGSYQRGYDFIVRLHILHELEDCLGNIFQTGDPDGKERHDVDTMMSNWNKRLEITRASFQAREPILSLRRVTLKLLSSDAEAVNVEDHCWLKSAKVARKAGNFQTAYSYLLNVSSLCNTTECCLEQAKLLWAQGNCHQALLRLEKWLAESKSSNDGSNSNLTKAKTLLFIARWMEETANYGPQPVLAQYKEVVSLNGQWESAHFYLAKYYDKIMNSFADTKKTGTLDFLPFVMKHYGDSLQYGNKFIYQSVPKILQFWLDFGANVPDQGKAGKSDRGGMQQRLTALNDIMSDLTERLPAYQFFTAFSQLISRMCHRNEQVWEILKKLISKLLVTYPQQAIWLIMAVSKSTVTLRKTRCQQIFQSAKRADKKLSRFIEDACKLGQLLIEVSEKSSKGKENTLSMTNDFGILKRLVTDDHFSSIIIPLQSSLTVALPSGRGAHKDHYPFPDSQPTFLGFEDKVEVLQSLARPKKIIARGSDGQSYILLCKPKDDLRKDSRTMEFNGLINKCLRKDPECRRRQLHIRTYAVIPLNEECGLLEWVPNTSGLRNILTRMYKEKGMYMRSGDLRKLYDRMQIRTNNDSKERINIFNTQLLKLYPPIFHEWFLKTFPTPTSWYNSRLAYCRTMAVISMVGYILGLGDRHGENILFDSTNGDCVHVDFNCLFNKGETFECPEVVPFRLTHNMVRVMGPLGYEGIFRRSCEVTLKLMRTQHDSLLSVLKTFVYDPLVEWGERRHRDTAGSSAAKEEGLKIIKQIEQRLLGYSAKNKILIPLSIEGEVYQLITDATDVDNLSRMYVGWAAYL